MTDLTWRIDVGNGDRNVTGADTTILTMPDGMYVEVDGKPTLNVIPLGRFLRQIAVKQAADIGELLHHADFILTSDPAIIQERGRIHECPECELSVLTALDYLRQHPGEELLMGSLFWAEDD